MNKIFRLAYPILFGLLLTLGSARAAGGSIQVLCAAGLKPPLAEIATAFQQKTGIAVAVTYGPSNLLLGQLKVGKRGDVFLPADQFYINEAKKAGLVQDTRTVAYLVPVIMVPKGNPRQITSINDLTRPGLRLGLADARTAAIGRTAREVVTKNRIPLAEIERNVVYSSTTVNELGDALKLRHIDATIIWSAVARQYAEVSEMVLIPAKKNTIVTIQAAQVARTANAVATRRFLDFLCSAPARAIFVKYHYDVKPPKR